ncbi:hypothetical protein RINTHM_13010 [Richelia intracellularis HM01]|nr:hypothetical protein RINTHM_13010 [Richelia intracellularis HM01]
MIINFAGTWLVIYFHPKNNNSACRAEAKEFTSLNIYFPL